MTAPRSTAASSPGFPDEFERADGAAPGPELGPGDYYVTVLGLTRRGLTRPDPNPEDPNDPEPVLARDGQKVVVREKGEGALVSGFHLIGADECADGIDNDNDGSVDLADPPCRDGQTREDLDLSGALFTFEATLLGGDNPRATCSGLGLASFRITLDGDGAGARTIPCTTTVQSFSADLPPGEHSWTVEGLDRDGVPVTESLTDPNNANFTIGQTGFALVPIVVDFSIAFFLAEPPFRGPLSFLDRVPALPRRAAGPPLRPHQPLSTSATSCSAPPASPLLTDGQPQRPGHASYEAPFPVEDLCSELTGFRNTSDLVWSTLRGRDPLRPAGRGLGRRRRRQGPLLLQRRRPRATRAEHQPRARGPARAHRRRLRRLHLERTMHPLRGRRVPHLSPTLP